jgi:peptidoglycan/xylan/chitin deacetylase (PgdA/CDA1 family)
MLYSKGYLITDDYALSEVSIVPLARGIVSVTFDDFFNPLYDTAYPMFKSRGLPATAYLVTEDFGKPNTLGPEKIQEMQAGGFEIASHTVTHPHLPLINSVDVQTELAKSQLDILSFVGTKPVNFASPYGEYNDAVKQQIAQYYRSHRSVDVGFNTKDNFDILNIKAMSVINTTPPETILSWVDEAIRDRAWLVLVYHDVVDGGGTFTTTPDQLRAVLDGLVARGVSVQTVDSALNEVVPQMQ